MVNSNDFKQAMSQFTAGVTVVTTRHEGKPIGITATAFSSVSAEPPLILINLNKGLFTHKVIEKSGIFAVNFLGAHQLDWGMRFAGMFPDIKDRFAGIQIATAETGCPILPNCLGWVDCEVWAITDGGDHSIIVGEVKAANGAAGLAPLLYHDRKWGKSAGVDGSHLPKNVTVVEVGPRDGFQRQEKYIPAEMKVDIINQLAEAGLKRIQVASFVHPKVTPQMADAEEVCANLPKRDDVIYSGLVLNMRGLERASNAGIKHVEMGVPASETLSQKNVRYSIAQGMELMGQMTEKAHAWGMTVRLGVQAAFGCAFEGTIDQEKVIDMAHKFLEMGADELALADSAGLGNPRQIGRTIERIAPWAGETAIALHLHDTRGQGLANLMAGLNAGITRFDTSFGGLGGCPFIPAAKGNIPTEDTAHLLHEMGVETGVDLAKVGAISRQIEQFLEVELPGKVHKL